MSLRVQRLVGLLALATLATPPAATVDAAVRSETRLQASSSGTKAPRRRAARRRARPAPPGGVWARNAVVIDPATDQVLYEKNAGASVPIASLSKLMTALVFVEQEIDMDRVVEVTRVEIAGGGRTQLNSRERLSLRDLLHMSLMISDNVATRVLVREAGMSSEDFLARMNRRAVELGMARTRFVEFTGLDPRNVSTATDCARLLRAAGECPALREIMTKRTHEFRSASRPFVVGNTNRLLYGRYEIRGGKTGFIAAAGYCLATWIHSPGGDRIAVVLGAPSPATRFADVTRLVQRTHPPGVPQTN